VNDWDDDENSLSKEEGESEEEGDEVIDCGKSILSLNSVIHSQASHTSKSMQSILSRKASDPVMVE
jgi:hypothetical protein